MEPFRYVVGTSDCDALGHMNVARYVALCNLAGTEMQRRIGWPPGQPNAGRRYSFAAVNMQSEFMGEVLEGEVLLTFTGIERIGTKSATFDNRIHRATGEIVFRSLWKSALLDLDTRRAVAVPDDLRTVLDGLKLPPVQAGLPGAAG